jgi:inner membrane protein
MPSPIGHSLIGYIIYRASPMPVKAPPWQLIIFCLIAANAPDFDFLPGLLIGNAARFHHGPSHSIGFAILFGLVAGVFFLRRLYGFVISASLYLSHVLLDYLVLDPSPPHGVPLFWPLSYEYYMAPFAFFPGVVYTPIFSDSILFLFTFHNLLTISTEILFFLPLLIFTSFWKKSAPG